MTLKRIAEMPDSWVGKAQITSAHLGLWLRCLMHHGQAVESFEGKVRKNNYGRVVKIHGWAKQDGWKSGKSSGIEGEALTHYSAQLDHLRNAGARPPMGAAFERALRDIAAEVRTAGATPILIASPAADTRQRFAPPAGIEAWIFNDHERNPELFQPEWRYDTCHLNPRGAELFTRLLARRFSHIQNANK